jgi:methionine-rich copper-binding protein CopC
MELLLPTLTIALALTAGPAFVARGSHDLTRQSQAPNASNVLMVDSVQSDSAELPNEIAVDFDAPIEARLVKIEVVDQMGVDHAVGAPFVRADHRRISVRVDHMGPGTFTVNWGIVDAEGKRTEGAHSFTFEAQRILL